MTMRVQDLRQLLTDALPASYDADTKAPTTAELFTPDTHRMALEPDVTLVFGGRGVGKTVWFQSLQQDDHRTLAAEQYQLPRLRSMIVSPGYGSHLDPTRYPGPGRLRALLREFDAEVIWQAVCLHALQTSAPASPDWTAHVATLRDDPAYFEEVLSRIDRKTEGRGVRVVLFDALDRMSSSVEETNLLVEGLLRVALELRTRTRSVRAKIFARPDLVSESRFTDVSKLRANSSELRWTDTNLYGLLFTFMGNARTVEAERFRRETGRGWREVAPSVWRDSRLIGDAEAQADLFTLIAGPYMGTNHRRGRTYPWLPNHLADGHQQASPRSFLAAIRRASDETRARRASHDYALHFDSIKEGVRHASQIRVDEITEDMPWVATAMRGLAGMTVPVRSEELYDRWESRGILDTLDQYGSVDEDADVRMGPSNPREPAALINDLEKLGVMTRRADGRIDVPDVYRVAFGMGRMGGIPKVRAG